MSTLHHTQKKILLGQTPSSNYYQGSGFPTFARGPIHFSALFAALFFAFPPLVATYNPISPEFKSDNSYCVAALVHEGPEIPLILACPCFSFSA
jgi:hypothetical protein